MSIVRLSSHCKY